MPDKQQGTYSGPDPQPEDMWPDWWTEPQVAKADYKSRLIGWIKQYVPKDLLAQFQREARAHAGGSAYKPAREWTALSGITADKLHGLSDDHLARVHGRIGALVDADAVDDAETLHDIAVLVEQELEARGMAEKSITFIAKDAKQQKAYGVVYEPYTVDSQGDWATPEEIEKACHAYMEAYRKTGLRHDGKARDDIIILENYIAPHEMRIGDQAVARGAWVMAVGVKDKSAWADVESGALTGLSLFGKAHRTAGEPPVEKGGSGSGNYGHAGRPGEVGGSMPGGGMGTIGGGGAEEPVQGEATKGPASKNQAKQGKSPLGPARELSEDALVRIVTDYQSKTIKDEWGDPMDRMLAVRWTTRPEAGTDRASINHQTGQTEMGLSIEPLAPVPAHWKGKEREWVRQQVQSYSYLPGKPYIFHGWVYQEAKGSDGERLMEASSSTVVGFASAAVMQKAHRTAGEPPVAKGGFGSGNYGHAGRPGEVGGSMPGGGMGGIGGGPIESVKRWVSQDGKEVRVYARSVDAREGTKYITGNRFQPKGTVEGGLTSEEWNEVKRVAFDAETKRYKTVYNERPKEAPMSRDEAARILGVRYPDAPKSKIARLTEERQAAQRRVNPSRDLEEDARTDIEADRAYQRMQEANARSAPRGEFDTE